MKISFETGILSINQMIIMAAKLSRDIVFCYQSKENYADMSPVKQKYKEKNQ